MKKILVLTGVLGAAIAAFYLPPLFGYPLLVVCGGLAAWLIYRAVVELQKMTARQERTEKLRRMMSTYARTGDPRLGMEIDELSIQVRKEAE